MGYTVCMYTIIGVNVCTVLVETRLRICPARSLQTFSSGCHDTVGERFGISSCSISAIKRIVIGSCVCRLNIIQLANNSTAMPRRHFQVIPAKWLGED